MRLQVLNAKKKQKIQISMIFLGFLPLLIRAKDYLASQSKQPPSARTADSDASRRRAIFEDEQEFLVCKYH